MAVRIPKNVSTKTLRYMHKYQCSARVKPEPTTIETDEPPVQAPPKPLQSRIKRTRQHIAAPATPTIMQTPCMRKPPVRRYEHINLF